MAKVLIVDDSWLTRRGVKRILQAESYEVCEGENGLQGLEMLRSDDSIHAVILDLLMPEMNGMEFLEAMGNESFSLPVVVLTADIQDTVKERCMVLGAKAFLNKPPKPDELKSVLYELLTWEKR